MIPEYLMPLLVRVNELMGSLIYFTTRRTGNAFNRLQRYYVMCEGGQDATLTKIVNKLVFYF